MAGQKPTSLTAEDGFTLIELLTVVLVLGVLAAIALPAFTSQRAKATDASAKSTAVRLAKAIEECRLGVSSYAQCMDASSLNVPDVKWGTGDGEAGTYPSFATASYFALYVHSGSRLPNGQRKIFYYLKDTGTGVTRSCGDEDGNPVTVGCPGGRW